MFAVIKLPSAVCNINNNFFNLQVANEVILSVYTYSKKLLCSIAYHTVIAVSRRCHRSGDTETARISNKCIGAQETRETTHLTSYI